MRIRIITPAPPRSRQGNRVTALRWAGLLRNLGHRVTLGENYRHGNCDCLIALHARRSAESIERFRRRWPHRPLVVALTGTDVYGGLRRDMAALRSLDAATRLVVLQPLAVEELPIQERAKARAIIQSARPPLRRPAPVQGVFEVCVMGHLRPVKDPFRTAQAARRLPASSLIRVVHIGAALSADMQRRARAEQAANPRYRWLGELPRPRALACLARSRLLVLSSQLEGGANVVSEALAAGVPIVSTRIPGSVGILGKDYPGYFPVGDTAALAALLERAEADHDFYSVLKRSCRRLAPLVRPEREQASLRKLLRELKISPAPANSR